MNEGTGTTVVDSGGNTQENGTITGAAWGTTAPTLSADFHMIEAGQTLASRMEVSNSGGTDVTASATKFLADNADHGSVTLDTTYGTWSYTPTSGYVGFDTFTLQATDSGVTYNEEIEVLVIPDLAASVTGSSGNDASLNAASNANSFLNGLAGNDTITGLGGSDYLRGGAGSDILNGGAGADLLDGGNSSEIDTLNGGSGADFLRGGPGGDTLNGDADNDTLYGGLGQDILTGGTGADHFFYFERTETTRSVSTSDAIVDFHSTESDKIVLESSGFGNIQPMASGSTYFEINWSGASRSELNRAMRRGDLDALVTAPTNSDYVAFLTFTDNDTSDGADGSGTFLLYDDNLAEAGVEVIAHMENITAASFSEADVMVV